MKNNEELSYILVPKKTIIKIDGIPFELPAMSIIKGNKNNLNLIQSVKLIEIDNI